jgi:hypothetical protein
MKSQTDGYGSFAGKIKGKKKHSELATSVRSNPFFFDIQMDLA